MQHTGSGVQRVWCDVCVEEKGCDGLRGYCADEINVSNRINEGVVCFEWQEP